MWNLLLCEQKFDFPGYYVIDLPEKILLEDKKFGIGIEFLGCDFYIACETRENLFSSKAIGEKNKNFYGDQYGFQDFYGKQYDFTNFCIKAFTEKNVSLAKKVDYKSFSQKYDITKKSIDLLKPNIKNKPKKKYRFKYKLKFVLIMILLIIILIFALKIILKQ